MHKWRYEYVREWNIYSVEIKMFRIKSLKSINKNDS